MRVRTDAAGESANATEENKPAETSTPVPIANSLRKGTRRAIVRCSAHGSSVRRWASKRQTSARGRYCCSVVILEIRYHRARTALVWPNSAQAFKRAAASEYAWRASTQAPRTQRDQAAYSYLAIHANPPHTIQEHLKSCTTCCRRCLDRAGRKDSGAEAGHSH